MADIFSAEKRSEIMRRVKSSGNSSTEFKLVQYFKKYKIKGWRRNYKLFGKPDIVFPKLRLAIFLDGCFWHGHDCRNTKPKSNQDYWISKIEKNKIRDINVTQALIKKGWHVKRIWECDIKKAEKLDFLRIELENGLI